MNEKVSWTIIFTDTIHYAILFIENATMPGTTKPIRHLSTSFTLIASDVHWSYFPTSLLKFTHL